MKVSKKLFTDKIIFSVISVCLSLIVTFYMQDVLQNKKSSLNLLSLAQQVDTFIPTEHSEDSSVVMIDSVSFISLKAKNTLFSSSKSGVVASYKALSAIEKVMMPNELKQGEDIDTIKETVNKYLLPSHYSKNVKLVRSSEDKTVHYPLINKDVSHYVFQQNVNINQKLYPVLGATIRVDIKNNKDLVAIHGIVLNSSKVQNGSLSKSTAEKNALDEAVSENKNVELKLCENTNTELVIINKNVLGIKRDDTNYVTYSVDICSVEDPPAYSKKYYISKKSGDVIFSRLTTYDALNRKIYDCQNSLAACIEKRIEGGNPSDKDVNILYDAFGETYTMLFDIFKRDSIDGKGLPMVGNINYQSTQCPFSSWSEISLETMFCTGVVARDIAVHEVVHGLTQFTANLIYESQSGAINESISDIFAHFIDRDDWKIGEDLVTGVLRNMDNPTEKIIHRQANGLQFEISQPDKLFSPHYYTGSDGAKGVHINSGILNYAYYLMSAGGTFNGFTVLGLGDDVAMPVIHRALTVYLTETSNFCDVYISVITACNDIYGESSNQCTQIKTAMQAVELDYQPKGIQERPDEKGTNPRCILGSSVTPTVTPSHTPTPTGPTLTPTISPTGKVAECNQTCLSAGYVCKSGLTCYTQTPAMPGSDVCRNPDCITKTDCICNTPNTTPTVTPIPTTTLTSTPTTNPTTTLTATPTPETNGELDLNIWLKFQGILKKPGSGRDTMSVRIGLYSLTMDEPVYKQVTFTADDDGIWYGNANFNLPDGFYVVYVKGPGHLQKKVGDLLPKETYPGTYLSYKNMIELEEGEIDLDFAGITQPVGDVANPVQDGMVNANDIGYIVAHYNDTNNPLCDLNRDGICGTQDHALIIEALSIRFDQDYN